MTTLTQRRRTTPGARCFWNRPTTPTTAPAPTAWTIIGVRANPDGTESRMTASAFGRTGDEAIERFLVQQARQRPNVFGELPPRFDRDELCAEVAL